MDRNKVVEKLEELIIAIAANLLAQTEKGRCPNRKKISALVYLVDTYADVTREDY